MKNRGNLNGKIKYTITFTAIFLLIIFTSINNGISYSIDKNSDIMGNENSLSSSMVVSDFDYLVGTSYGYNITYNPSYFPSGYAFDQSIEYHQFYVFDLTTAGSSLNITISEKNGTEIGNLGGAIEFNILTNETFTSFHFLCLGILNGSSLSQIAPFSNESTWSVDDVNFIAMYQDPFETSLNISYEYSIDGYLLEMRKLNNGNPYLVMSYYEPPPPETAPNAPVLHDSTNYETISLSWSIIENANYYRIYEDDEYVDQTTGNTYSFTRYDYSKTYTYKVKAVNEVGESPFSNDVHFSPVESPEEEEPDGGVLSSSLLSLMFVFGIFLVIRIKKSKRRGNEN